MIASRRFRLPTNESLWEVGMSSLNINHLEAPNNRKIKIDIFEKPFVCSMMTESIQGRISTDPDQGRISIVQPRQELRQFLPNKGRTKSIFDLANAKMKSVCDRWKPERIRFPFNERENEVELGPLTARTKSILVREKPKGSRFRSNESRSQVNFGPFKAKSKSIPAQQKPKPNRLRSNGDENARDFFSSTTKKQMKKCTTMAVEAFWSALFTTRFCFYEATFLKLSFRFWTKQDLFISVKYRLV